MLTWVLTPVPPLATVSALVRLSVPALTVLRALSTPEMVEDPVTAKAEEVAERKSASTK